ncbi:diphosphate--fructose-6-phosphate 1-phosphotransferase [Salinicoccus albus]|uniref:diphosphate--fructose-6-phosphate 1-phosphotransferase n=1 Tax=Salinicoccus albus TaxID=418756 RepID=UPI00036B9EC4|nr:diphosphate--fructose-6-phosphate 1-phosphotransferase [Salinicoccus albus]
MKNIVIGQAGGPTSVMNATLAGLTEALMEENSLTFLKQGYEGLSQNRFLNDDSYVLDWILSHKNIPGACLGSGRYALDGVKLEACADNLKRLNADALVVIGGNGTMEALRKIEQKTMERNYQLQVIGLPKTVDNDLGCTDHAPGFASAANYIARATLDMGRDLYAMKNFEQVRILETMGRNTGWLAAASGLFKAYEEDGPHFIAIPEQKLVKQDLLKSVEASVNKYGCALIVTSEGVQWDSGSQMNRKVINGRPVLGGISAGIEAEIQKELGFTSRSELLGMNQRSASALVTETDREEAYQAGAAGGKWVKAGLTDMMAAFQRSDDAHYHINIEPVSLKAVADYGERQMPEQFSSDLSAYYNWLKPLVDNKMVSYPSLAPRRENDGKREL